MSQRQKTPAVAPQATDGGKQAGNQSAETAMSRAANAVTALNAAVKSRRASVLKAARTRRKNKKIKAELMVKIMRRAQYRKIPKAKAEKFAERVIPEIMSGQITLDKIKYPKRLICSVCYEIGCNIGPMVTLDY